MSRLGSSRTLLTSWLPPRPSIVPSPTTALLLVFAAVISALQPLSLAVIRPQLAVPWVLSNWRGSRDANKVTRLSIHSVTPLGRFSGPDRNAFAPFAPDVRRTTLFVERPVLAAFVHAVSAAWMRVVSGAVLAASALSGSRSYACAVSVAGSV
ncbi:hypothetical protein [Paraburkholderia sp. PGU19]|uniref:hypothetical protein n=1 Tax=Paraburkholderia sp. PGU19 TaxID=2735434 RepID=UPI001FB13F18|nr:hypothetical protein [Paraburkholderia sp. PGU19]